VIRCGRVEGFDPVRGTGEVADDDGGAVRSFHAANIADGSRRIDLGARVVFALLPRFGAWEATAIRTVG
jgi:hypothetical protein